MEQKIINYKNQEKKNTLINNTIVGADNNYKKKVKDAFLELDKYLIDDKFKLSATILKDANVVAASINHVLLTYKYSSMVEENDNEILNITELLQNLLNNHYKIVAITEDDWKKERPKYIKLKKENKLNFIEEKEIIDDKRIELKLENTIDNYVEMFGSELLEMEG